MTIWEGVYGICVGGPVTQLADDIDWDASLVGAGSPPSPEAVAPEVGYIHGGAQGAFEVLQEASGGEGDWR